MSVMFDVLFIFGWGYWIVVFLIEAARKGKGMDGFNSESDGGCEEVSGGKPRDDNL